MRAPPPTSIFVSSVQKELAAERRAVKVAASAASQEVELIAGVAAGERVAIEAPATLADGAAVAERKP